MASITRRSALGMIAAAASLQTRAARNRSQDAPFTLADANGVMPVIADPALPTWALKAAQHLRTDIASIVGREPEAGASPGSRGLWIATAQSPWLRQRAPKHVVADAELLGRREAFVIRRVGDSAAIIGADADGVRRGVYFMCSELLGVDPLHRFTGCRPRRSQALHLDQIDYDGAPPAAPLRGWFLNDEDLLTEWFDGPGRRRIDYPFYNQVIASEALDAVLESAARLGMNTIIPASFIDIRNPDEKRVLDQAADWGFWLHQHHIEPIGVSAFGYANYWRDQGREPPVFSYFSSRAELEQIWKDYIDRWSSYPRVVWGLGHRGIADRPLWMADPAVPRDDATIGRIVSEAIAFQHRSIIEATRGREHQFAASLWAEGSALMAGGHLRIPDDVIVLFADNGPGFRMQRDFYTMRDRVKRAGVYYHQQIWGSGPHLVQATPPARTSAVLRDAFAENAVDLVLVNVGNVREFAVGLSITAGLLIDGECSNVDVTLIETCRRWFGDEHAVAGARLYRALFDAYVIDPVERRPVLLDGLVRQRGLEVLKSIERARSGAQEPQEQGSTESADTRAFVSRHLPDMRNIELSDPEVSVLIARQRGAFKIIADEAKSLSASINDAGGEWLESNVSVQASIMLGLLDWLSHLLSARAAMPDGVAAKELEAGARALEAAIAARKLAERGAFARWYVGDRKLNAADLIARTRATLALVEAA